MNDSILLTIKKMLGLNSDFDCYDLDIIIYINTAFATLQNIGVGPEKGFRITGDLDVWSQFLDDPVLLDHAKTYIYLKVKQLFDPPSSSFVLDALNKSMEELEWRLNIRADDWAHTKVGDVDEE